MRGKKISLRLVIALILIFGLVIVIAPAVCADTWASLPPYNVLWPLWSPALSPVDPLTGLAVPLVNSLSTSTVLPSQPGLAWNPYLSYPYLLFNTPVGLSYYDPLYGINVWPPHYLVDSATGNPFPIPLPLGWNLLPPTDPLWIQENVPIANLAYLAAYQTYAQQAYTYNLPTNLIGIDPWLVSLTYPTPALSSLLTPALILGY